MNFSIILSSFLKDPIQISTGNALNLLAKKNRQLEQLSFLNQRCAAVESSSFKCQ